MSSTYSCIDAVSASSNGLIKESMSECLCDLTGVMLTWAISFTVLPNSGIAEKHPIEPVRVVASENMWSQLLEIQ